MVLPEQKDQPHSGGRKREGVPKLHMVRAVFQAEQGQCAAVDTDKPRVLPSARGAAPPAAAAVRGF